LVASSGGATSAEAANILNPAADTYTVRVVGFATGSGAASFKLHSFVLGSEAAGNMLVTAPASAVIGATGTIGITTSGLTAGTRYLGSVAYAGVAGLPNRRSLRSTRNALDNVRYARRQRPGEQSPGRFFIGRHN
jgi:hypothetical protein